MAICRLRATSRRAFSEPRPLALPAKQPLAGIPDASGARNQHRRGSIPRSTAIWERGGLGPAGSRAEDRGAAVGGRGGIANDLGVWQSLPQRLLAGRNPFGSKRSMGISKWERGRFWSCAGLGPLSLEGGGFHPSGISDPRPSCHDPTPPPYPLRAGGRGGRRSAAGRPPAGARSPHTAPPPLRRRRRRPSGRGPRALRTRGRHPGGRANTGEAVAEQNGASGGSSGRLGTETSHAVRRTKIEKNNVYYIGSNRAFKKTRTLFQK